MESEVVRGVPVDGGDLGASGDAAAGSDCPRSQRIRKTLPNLS